MRSVCEPQSKALSSAQVKGGDCHGRGSARASTVEKVTEKEKSERLNAVCNLCHSGQGHVERLAGSGGGWALHCVAPSSAGAAASEVTELSSPPAFTPIHHYDQ